MGTNVYLLEMSRQKGIHGRWVEAISQDIGAVGDHVKSIHLDDHSSLGIYAVLLDEPPPFYVIFFHGYLCGCSWKVVGRQGASEYVRNIQKRPYDEQFKPHCVLYGIGEGFFSSCPGEDNMGVIPHHHVDDDFLDAVKKKGWRSVEKEYFHQGHKHERKTRPS